MTSESQNTRGWVVVIASFLIQFITNGTQFVYSSGIMAEEKNSVFYEGDARRHVNVKVLLVVLPVVSQIIGFLLCLLISRLGCRNISVAGASLSGLALVLTFIADYYQYYPFAACALQGIGYGMLNCLTIICVAHHFEKKRTLAIALILSGAHLGRFAYTPLTNFLLEHWHWKGVEVIHAGLVFNCIPFGLLLSPLPAEKSDLRKAARSCEAKTARQKEKYPHELVAMEAIHQERAEELETFNTPDEKKIREEDSPQTSAHGDVPADSTIPESRGSCRYSFKEALGISTFQSTTFLLFIISNMFASVGFSWSLFCLHSAIVDSVHYTVWEVIAQSFVPILFGVVASHPKVTVETLLHKLYVSLLLFCGVFAVMAPASADDEYAALYTCILVFAVFASCFAAWTPILLLELVGRDRFTVAFVWLSAAAQVVVVVHELLFDLIADATGSHEVSLRYTGVLTFLCGLLMFGTSYVHRRVQRRASSKLEAPEGEALLE